MTASEMQANLLETARSLILSDPDRFSVAALCRETGLSRNKMRQYFPTKAALMTALLEEEPDAATMDDLSDPDDSRDENFHDAESGAQIIGEGWIERRFRVLERALTLLGTKSEGASAGHSQALALIEERLSGAAKAPPAELPPIMAANAPAPKAPVAGPPIVAAPSLSAEPAIIPPLEFPPPAPAFDARQKLQTILKKKPAETPIEAMVRPENKRGPKEAPLWMMVSAGLISMALLVAMLSTLSTTRNAPQAKPAQNAATPKQASSNTGTPAAIASSRQDHNSGSPVVVIDATGAQPQSVAPQIDQRAERGDAHAKIEAALAYLRGEGVETDTGAAMRWAQTAAAQGDATAQFILGSLYAKGMAPDLRHAVKWYEAAAAQGNVKAMHNLALAYLSGDGVERNAAAATAWFTKAANGGYVDSAMNLAVLYDRGEEVERSPREALRWYDDAAAKGDIEAGRRAKTLRRQLARVADR